MKKLKGVNALYNNHNNEGKLEGIISSHVDDLQKTVSLWRILQIRFRKSWIYLN